MNVSYHQSRLNGSTVYDALDGRVTYNAHMNYDKSKQITVKRRKLSKKKGQGVKKSSSDIDSSSSSSEEEEDDDDDDDNDDDDDDNNNDANLGEEYEYIVGHPDSTFDAKKPADLLKEIRIPKIYPMYKGKYLEPTNYIKTGIVSPDELLAHRRDLALRLLLKSNGDTEEDSEVEDLIMPSEIPILSRLDVKRLTGTDLPDADLLNVIHYYFTERISRSERAILRRENRKGKYSVKRELFKFTRSVGSQREWGDINNDEDHREISSKRRGAEMEAAPPVGDDDVATTEESSESDESDPVLGLDEDLDDDIDDDDYHDSNSSGDEGEGITERGNKPSQRNGKRGGDREKANNTTTKKRSGQSYKLDLYNKAKSNRDFESRYYEFMDESALISLGVLVETMIDEMIEGEDGNLFMHYMEMDPDNDQNIKDENIDQGEETEGVYVNSSSSGGDEDDD